MLLLFDVEQYPNFEFFVVNQLLLFFYLFFLFFYDVVVSVDILCFFLDACLTVCNISYWHIIIAIIVSI